MSVVVFHRRVSDQPQCLSDLWQRNLFWSNQRKKTKNFFVHRLRLEFVDLQIGVSRRSFVSLVRRQRHSVLSKQFDPIARLRQFVEKWNSLFKVSRTIDFFLPVLFDDVSRCRSTSNLYFEYEFVTPRLNGNERRRRTIETRKVRFVEHRFRKFDRRHGDGTGGISLLVGHPIDHSMSK